LIFAGLQPALPTAALKSDRRKWLRRRERLKTKDQKTACYTAQPFRLSFEVIKNEPFSHAFAFAGGLVGGRVQPGDYHHEN
jgi:hypothetical protein